MNDRPEVPEGDETIKVNRDQYVQLIADLWDDNQEIREKCRELERRNEILENWTRGIGHTNELIDLADVVAELAELAGVRPTGDARLLKAFEIARRFVAENPKHGRRR